MHENSHPRFQLPAGQSHVKSGSATSRRPLSSPPGHVEPWSRVAVAVISVLRCHQRTPPRTAVSTSALHVGPSADRSLARSCRGAPCSPWGEDPVGRGASIPTDGRACSGCACRALAEPAGAAPVLAALSSGSAQSPSPPGPSVGASTASRAHTHAHRLVGGLQGRAHHEDS